VGGAEGDGLVDHGQGRKEVGEAGGADHEEAAAVGHDAAELEQGGKRHDAVPQPVGHAHDEAVAPGRERQVDRREGRHGAQVGDGGG